MKVCDAHWYSAVEAPLVVERAETVAWDDQADVVIVGFGGAGAAAAAQACQLGLHVIAVDRQQGGGATAASGGVFYAGGGTHVQKQLGIEDTPEEMFRYLQLETQGVVRADTLRRFCEESAATVDWLTQLGTKFGGPCWPHKTSYPGAKYFLYHPDNSLLPSAKAVAKPAPRGHRAVVPPRFSKKAIGLVGPIFEPMRDAALALGMKLHRKTEARQLVIDRRGRVLGVKALQFEPGSREEIEHDNSLRRGTRLAATYPFFLPGAAYVHSVAKRHLSRAAELEATARRVRFYRAREGVVLSAGGFVFNREMMKHHAPKYSAGIPLGTPGDDGSGIRLGQSVGAATDRLDRATAWRFINPPLAWSNGIIVNRRGERIVNESCYGATIGDAIVERNDGQAWLVLDKELVARSRREALPGKLLGFQWQLAWFNLLFALHRAPSTTALATHIGASLATLQATIDDNNLAAAGRKPDDFGKDPEDMHVLRAPFYVIDASLGARFFPCPVLTMGGLVVDEESGAVKNEAGRAIPGLYAAGRTAVGIPSHLYMSGLSIADCVFSGRRAARSIAQKRNTPLPGIPNGELSDAEMAMPSALRVSTGSRMPSSHNSDVE
jgi:3-oxo-5alpha-steroid 4-dehydrogenase